MSVASVDSIERTIHKTNGWIGDLESELGIDNPAYAWRSLRAYLQVLRDRLTIDEGAHLAAELPQLLRGAFYEGFDPGRQPNASVIVKPFLSAWRSAPSLTTSTRLRALPRRRRAYCGGRSHLTRSMTPSPRCPRRSERFSRRAEIIDAVRNSSAPQRRRHWSLDERLTVGGCG
jgi:uncharacterized protein (DUF2267 family)